MTEHYRKLERMYQTAPVNEFYKPVMHISEGMAEIEIEIDKRFFHAAHAVHGSVYFKMLDDAAFFAANSIVEEVFVLTVSYNIHLVRPVDSGILKSVGIVNFRSKNLFVAESTLYNDKDKKIAFGTGNFMRSKVALTEDIGYK